MLSWLILLLIGTSITFSTLHSHHPLEWDHVKSHVDTGNCLVDNTNVCPICGYLFNAQTVEPQSQTGCITRSGYAVILSESVGCTIQTDQPTGRAPPFFG